jgi:hypothetical protein
MPRCLHVLLTGTIVTIGLLAITEVVTANFASRECKGDVIVHPTAPESNTMQIACAKREPVLVQEVVYVVSTANTMKCAFQPWMSIHMDRLWNCEEVFIDQSNDHQPIGTCAGQLMVTPTFSVGGPPPPESVKTTVSCQADQTPKGLVFMEATYGVSVCSYFVKPTAPGAYRKSGFWKCTP